MAICSKEILEPLDLMLNLQDPFARLIDGHK